MTYSERLVGGVCVPQGRNSVGMESIERERRRKSHSFIEKIFFMQPINEEIVHASFTPDIRVTIETVTPRGEVIQQKFSTPALVLVLLREDKNADPFACGNPKCEQKHFVGHPMTGAFGEAKTVEWLAAQAPHVLANLFSGMKPKGIDEL